jgi:hypothetical protein
VHALNLELNWVSQSLYKCWFKLCRPEWWTGPNWEGIFDTFWSRRYYYLSFRHYRSDLVFWVVPFVLLVLMVVPFKDESEAQLPSYPVVTSRKVAGFIPNEDIGFFNWPHPSSRTMALRSTQPLTEMSTRNRPGDKGRPACKAWQPHRHLWASCVENVGISTSQRPMDLHGLLQG